MQRDARASSTTARYRSRGPVDGHETRCDVLCAGVRAKYFKTHQTLQADSALWPFAVTRASDDMRFTLDFPKRNRYRVFECA